MNKSYENGCSNLQGGQNLWQKLAVQGIWCCGGMSWKQTSKMYITQFFSVDMSQNDIRILHDV